MVTSPVKNSYVSNQFCGGKLAPENRHFDFTATKEHSMKRRIDFKVEIRITYPQRKALRLLVFSFKGKTKIGVVANVCFVASL